MTSEVNRNNYQGRNVGIVTYDINNRALDEPGAIDAGFNGTIPAAFSRATAFNYANASLFARIPYESRGVFNEQAKLLSNHGRGITCYNPNPVRRCNVINPYNYEGYNNAGVGLIFQVEAPTGGTEIAQQTINSGINLQFIDTRQTFDLRRVNGCNSGDPRLPGNNKPCAYPNGYPYYPSTTIY